MEIGLEISEHNFGEIMTLLAHVAELQGIFRAFQGGLTCDKNGFIRLSTNKKAQTKTQPFFMNTLLLMVKTQRQSSI